MILDTNALSAWAEGTVGVEAPLRSADRLVVPSVVLGEYYFGIRQSRHRRRYEEWLARYLPQTEIATITSATADTYADIRLELKRLGTPIPPNDVWVAALARQHDLAVLTNDSHFDLVDQIMRIAICWATPKITFELDQDSGNRPVSPERLVRILARLLSQLYLLKGTVKLTDCRLFSAFLHEAKPLKLRKVAIDNLPRFRSESG